MKNKHIKRKLAEKHQSPESRKLRGMAGSPFNSIWWNQRRALIEDKVKRRVARVKIRKMERTQALLKGEKVVYSIK